MKITELLRLRRQNKLLALFYLVMFFDLIYYMSHPLRFTMMRGFGLFQFLGPDAACFAFLIYRYRQSITSVWNKELRRVIYGLAAAGSVILSKLLADRQIREDLQTNPCQFPSAQQALMAFNLVVMAMSFLTLFLEVTLFVYVVGGGLNTGGKRWYEFLVWIVKDKLPQPSAPWYSRTLKEIRKYIDAAIYVLAFSFVFQFTEIVSTGYGLTGLSGEDIDPVEELIIWSSFVPNQLTSGSHSGETKLFCQNLGATVWVSPASSDEIMPSEVVSAEKSKRQSSEQGLHHTFRLVHCKKSNNSLVK